MREEGEGRGMKRLIEAGMCIWTKVALGQAGMIVDDCMACSYQELGHRVRKYCFIGSSDGLLSQFKGPLAW